MKSFILPNNNSYKTAQTIPPPHYMHHVVLQNRSKDLFICFHSSDCERKIVHLAAPFLNAAAVAAADWEPGAAAAAAANNVLASSLAQLQLTPCWVRSNYVFQHFRLVFEILDLLVPLA